MRIIKTANYDETSKRAALIIASQVIINPKSVLGLATGSTPLGAYENLSQWCKAGHIDFSQVTTFNLDEYLGLSPEHDQSYRYYMNKNLFDKINIDIGNTHVPDGTVSDTEAECLKYDAALEACGGIDLQILGIGLDGHIGFNEPADCFTKQTHCVSLTESTIEANSRFFATIDDVPKKAITMGIKSIMDAKKILLMADGENKREIMNRALFGPITPQVPASILQLHPDLTVVVSNAL